MEILPSREQIQRTSVELLRTAGRIVTLRCFLPEQPFASHGDHFLNPLDTSVEEDTYEWPQWDSEGTYLERQDG